MVGVEGLRARQETVPKGGGRGPQIPRWEQSSEQHGRRRETTKRLTKGTKNRKHTLLRYAHSTIESITGSGNFCSGRDGARNTQLLSCAFVDTLRGRDVNSDRRVARHHFTSTSQIPIVRVR